uniref:Uncharacterized protein n=1 Tax=Oryza punctata TaxID=4537 RepID=A0A0E0LBB6_ORYPU
PLNFSTWPKLSPHPSCFFLPKPKPNRNLPISRELRSKEDRARGGRGAAPDLAPLPRGILPHLSSGWFVRFDVLGDQDGIVTTVVVLQSQRVSSIL